MSKQKEDVKVTLTKEVMVQHLIVKCALSPEKAKSVVDCLAVLQHDTLMRGGKVIWKNIGTLFLKIAPAKKMRSFGVERKVATRYKLRFIQSRNFIITKSPLKAVSLQDELNVLANMKFDE